MKILVVADEESGALWDYYDKSLTEGVDLIISCGDLKPEYLEFLETMVNCPLLYVHGNHDRYYAQRPPAGCTDIDGRLYDFRGLRILGLGGSMRYKPDRDGTMYSEPEMENRIRRLERRIMLMNGFDVLVTHAPARGYGDLDDYPHRGFDCFNSLLVRYKPKYMLYGHVHPSYARSVQKEQNHASGTRLINCCGYNFLEIGENEHPGKGRTGSALYDLYISLRSKRKTHVDG